MHKDREAIRRARNLKKPDEDAKRLAYGFRLCTSRYPSEQESQILRRLLDEQRAQFKADAQAAKKFFSVGDAKIDECSTPPKRRPGHASAMRSLISTPRSTVDRRPTDIYGRETKRR